MKKTLARANEDLINEFGEYIIKRKEYYTLLKTSKNLFIIINEMNKMCLVDKKRFCSIMDG